MPALPDAGAHHDPHATPQRHRALEHLRAVQVHGEDAAAGRQARDLRTERSCPISRTVAENPSSPLADPAAMPAGVALRVSRKGTFGYK